MQRIISASRVALVVLGLFASKVWAQAPLMPYQEYDKRIRASQVVGALKADLFGDSVSLYNGATEFSVVDVDLPGNDSLPVQVRRRFKIESRKEAQNFPSVPGFGGWEIDVPHIYGVFEGSSKWNVGQSGSTQRCSTLWQPKVTQPFEIKDVWAGNHMHLPGRGDQELLWIDGRSNPKPSDGHIYYWGTRGDLRLRCKPTTANGYPSEGFIAVDSNGTKYTFDIGVERWLGQIYKPAFLWGSSGELTSVSRVKVHLMASRVEDRHGNWVSYNYNGDKLTSITASDGRSIELVYSENRVTSVRAHGREWKYEYALTPFDQSAPNALARVVLPDGSSWRYQYSSALVPLYPQSDYATSDPRCTEPFEASDNFSLTATHPAGAVGTFNFSLTRHRRNGVPESACYLEYVDYDTMIGHYALAIPDYFDVYSLASKTISGPGVAPATWTYEYEVIPYGRTNAPSPCATCQDSKLVTVREPDGTSQESRFGVLYQGNDGRLLGSRTLSATGSAAQAQENVYVSESEAPSMPFPDEYGLSLSSDDASNTRIRPVRTTTISQDSTTFTSHVNTFDVFARPISATKSNSVGYSKVDTTEFFDDYAKWVLNQVKSAVTSGIETSRTDFDHATALPLRTYAFGKSQHTLGYYADGTLRTVTDGRNETTLLSNWKRGVPQRIQYPDGTGRSAVVNDSGWITATADENEYWTGYGYDAMGRMASIVYPTGDDIPWNNVTMSFQQISTADRGLPAGHWRSDRYQGTRHTHVYYDAMWRPVMELDFDAADATWNTQTQLLKRYDSVGNLIYQSYPTRHSGSYLDDRPGTRTTYDALGRVTRVEQDSELGVLAATTEYLPGLQTRTTNPRGAQTTNGYQAWDQPTYDFLRWSVQPEGKVIEVFRHPQLGAPEQVRQRNSDGSLQQSRHFVYDQFRQLCKRIEPETGATVMALDAAGNLEWSAAGLNLPSTTSCDYSIAHASGRRVDRGYSSRNRLVSLAFPDGNGNQTWTYTPDGLPVQITTYNDGGATSAINRYSYNKRRLMTGENLTQPGWYSWGIGYTYDANGSLASQWSATGLSIDYAPNALGQATRAGSLATGVTYHPNGGIAQFTYGNGIVHTMTQNTRQLPARVTDGAASDLTYAFDANANPVTIRDMNAVAGLYSGNRDLEYDGLDRLTHAHLHWAMVDNWTYDALDNIRSKSHFNGASTVNHNYWYDPSNRLTNLIDASTNATVVGLGYDVQGNLANKNGQNYGFDYGNRLREVTGKESYRYDAHGRRILASSPSLGNILSQYGFTGQLVYQHDERKGKGIDHVYLGGSLVATIDRIWATGASVVKYQHTEALGSPVAVTNDAGQVIERTQYEPYGAAINRTVDGVGYTGHVMDAATGLTYMQQRYYDPQIGRFLSVDPVSADGNTGGNFNRYKYAANGPYRFVDPDGRRDRDSLSAHPSNMAGASYGFKLLAEVRSPGPVGAVKSDVGNLPPQVSIRTEMRGKKTTMTVNGTIAGQWPSKNDVSKRALPGADGAYASADSYPTNGPYKGNEKAFGPNDILKTDDVRGRWIHGGGTGLADPSAPRQGWKPTMGCTRMQNEDMQELVDRVREVKRTFPAIDVPYSRVDE